MDSETGTERIVGNTGYKARTERSRRRDFVVLGVIVAFLMLILTMSGSLSIGEAVMAMIVFAFAGLAFLLSTNPPAPDNAGLTEFAASRRSDLGPFQEQHRGDGARSEDVQLLIEQYPQPCVLAGYDGRVYASNSGARDVFRLPKQGGLGLGIIRRPDVLRQLQDLEGGLTPEPLNIEITGTPDRFFEVWTRSVRIAGSSRVLLVLIELTELRRAEKARADFLANASHELRTPLTSLAGFIETMRGPAKDDPEAWDRFLEIMYGQTERMRRLIHDLLSLSRIELSEHRKPEKVLDFSALASETVEAMMPIARDQDVTLQFISSASSVNVHGVRDELTQVLQNLIENALKYTRPDTSVYVELACGLSADDAKLFTSRRWDDAARISILQNRSLPSDQFVAVRVSDEGEGIGRQHLPRLGERFYRVDEGRDRKVGGTGLGLAIVKHILARHRGGLAVESEVGRGSAFGFWLQQLPEKGKLRSAGDPPEATITHITPDALPVAPDDGGRA